MECKWEARSDEDGGDCGDEEIKLHFGGFEIYGSEILGNFFFMRSWRGGG